jgi:pantoate--beta-alanine ligase
MRIIYTIDEMKAYRRSHPADMGFVPTMGSLHDGHLSLIRKSKMENPQTVVSIYLNKTQFNDPKDFENYPVDHQKDLQMLSEVDVDIAFLPNFEEMYPDNYRFRVQEQQDSLELCGQDRPGHFDGVLTVVMKLFHIVSPTRSYFGEKDYQQLQLIKDMVKSFFLDVEVVACEIVRDEAGLALSSRNKKLSPNALLKARSFAQSLKDEQDLQILKKKLEQMDFSVDYITDKQDRRFAAVRIENVRLIDNVPL